MGGRRNKNIFHIALLACAGVFAVFYLFGANSIAKEHYAVKDAEEYAQVLRDKNNILEVELAEANSLYNLEELSVSLALEKVKKVSYIEVKEVSPLVLNK